METDRIYNEDCLETMSRMPEWFVDLTVTSPPYEDLREYDGYEFDWKPVLEHLYRVTKVGGVVMWNVNDSMQNGSETGTSFRQALYAMEIGFKLHDTMIWHKANPIPVRYNRYQPSFEYMFVFSKGKPKTVTLLKERNLGFGRKKEHNPNSKSASFQDKKSIKSCPYHKPHTTKYEKTMHNVWDMTCGFGHSAKDEIAHQHPAIMPEEMAKRHIYTWSNKDDLVYDPFMGSGTTAKAAFLLGRKFIGSEISEKYCDIAEKRLEMYMNQETLNL